MPDYFRAIALDYDGTITTGARPTSSMLAAIREVRASNRRVVLVTGRILTELVVEFPDAYEHFDAIVAENGAVLWCAGRARAVGAPVSAALESRLVAAGVALRRGTVILAMQKVHDPVVRQACVELGLDHQLLCNRAELMVLPAGVSKGTGLRAALAELGVSLHSTIGVGDAENDISLLEACEIGVAVRDSVESLKESADLVLDGVGTEALASFLSGDVLRGLPGTQPRRRCVEIGVDDDGAVVTIPASRIQVFIDGPTGAGKSYVAGLLAEALLRAGYSVCVLDMEGEHARLSELRGVVALGGREPLPPPDQVGRLVRHRFGSVVVDLSLRDSALKHTYAREVLDHLTEVRRDCGLPHWILVEEAHLMSGESIHRARARGSLCLVSYHPDWLPPGVLGDSDFRITVEACTRARLSAQSSGKPPIHFRPGAREIAHVRHHRKYADSCVAFERGFTFRDESGLVGTHAASLAEFRAGLGHVPRAVLAHHSGQHDFSRWVQDVFQDRDLATAIRRAEDAFRDEESESFRATIRELLALRYEIDDQCAEVVDSGGAGAAVRE